MPLKYEISLLLLEKGCCDQIKVGWCVKQSLFTAGLPGFFYRLPCSMTHQREIQCVVLPRVISLWDSFLEARWMGLVFHVSTHIWMLLLRTEVESCPGQREGQLLSAAHSHCLAKPARPPELWNWCPWVSGTLSVLA